MAFLQDAVEEFKTLNPAGKFAVIGVLAGAAIIGYAVYRNRVTSGGSAVNPPISSGVNPFTITTTTPQPATAITTPQQSVPGRIVRGIVHTTKQATSKVVAPVTSTHEAQGASPTRPIPQVAQIMQSLQNWSGHVTGATAQGATTVLSPHPAINQYRSPHPIEYSHGGGNRTI